MSKFVTSIGVDVEGLLAQLPKTAYVHGVTYNPQLTRVEVTWEDDSLMSRYTFPVEFTLAQLSAAEMPDGVRDLSGGAATVQTDRARAVDPKARLVQRVKR